MNRFSWSVSALALWAAAVGQASAQTAAPAGAPAETPSAAAASPADALDPVVVTGTRATTRTVLSSLAPIDVLPATELLRTGRQSPRDLVSTLVPSATTSGGGAGASFAVKTVSLRGLGADQTLVLVNGKRRHDTAILFVNGTTQSGQSPVDLDLIPSDSVQRIEVLRDGASAQYGSDALAGVINVILKNSDQGGSASALAGRTYHGDGDTLQLDANSGFKLGDGGHLNLSLEARSQERTLRKIYNPSQLYFPVNGRPDPREATADRYTSLVGSPAVQLYAFGYDAALPVTAGVEFYSFGTATSRNSVAYLGYRNPNATNNNIVVYPNGYSPLLKLHDRDFQYTAGFRGELSDWRWDLSTSFSRDTVNYYEDSSLNASLGPASPRNFYLGLLGFQEWTNNLDVTHEIGTGWFAKPLLLAAGAEYRQDQFTIGAGEPASYVDGGYVYPSGPFAGKASGGGAQGVSGFPDFTAGAWKRHNVSGYLSLEQALAEHWDFAVAGRYEHYSDFGDAATGKVSLRYEPVPQVAFRGTVSNGFRAPSLQQEHYASSSTIPVLINGQTSTVQYPVQLLPPDTAAARALGADSLRPEKSVNLSAGVVLRPLSDLSVSIDAYQIRINDRILQSGTLGPAAAVSAALASQGLNPQQAVFYYSNAADTRTRGVDIVADYRSDLGAFGKVKWTLSANLNHTKFLWVKPPPAQLAAAGLVLIDRSRIGDFTTGNPTNKVIANALWSWGRFDTNLRVTKFGRVITRGASGPAADEFLSPSVIADLEVTYRFTDRAGLTVGANNLFNKYPDKLKPVNQGATGFALYNTASPYGTNGGFYYTRLFYEF